MGNILIKKTPAKINLTLDVTGKLENGYHTLSMIMQSIDVCDELSFEKTADETILFSMNKDLPDKIPAEKNLVYKAAKLMKDTFKIDGGFKIHLTKNIPAAAGLAGGSSDCAATLIGINELCGLGLDIEKLCEIGVKLGADVPFCIRKGTMLAEGIGEILTPLAPLTGIPVLLIKPNISISTPYVYKHLKLNELDYHPDNKAVISYIKDNNIKKIAASLSNVLETVTIPENPIIAELKHYLTENGAIGSLMSGSGPTTFGIFENMETAKKAYEKAKADFPDFDVVLCQTM
ncbi:MAG: 4-(cytidine 5'-diphospho)-2-C-methyl-D-erythritol kinase [Butyribacter sp.]|jgi:4-(cytidine 5'-diphospho)-2-C-methyl-D-erythritol kinase|uniref:4-(cytidine 5'-diphospho)-2-C-methyl-D-erythritol kinase n=1 Tax=Butyribacter TaxID=2822463 RepID=UPI00033BE2E3|nr:4-(cytidine 5'-diphospho)-2-C-methyl-D-erythritol kinase [Clostridium sp.]MCQ5165769.1 4-(cytidine 5'-diphospho)-2-C-methyl-D-erythritol kinase [Roseburia hominis]OKZ79101.1 MAG: 4-(cytidine 5'-diphospho)-2-C-methyl-D-erythritol kinase [Clostridium sp. CAG:12237_41]CCZ41906.1 4-diphosphocytidyl-2-C-methyl-D-erythritol kinase [Clostridium sp. CAG:122]